MWQAWTNGILGLWIGVAPFLLTDVSSVKLNNILAGAIVAVVGWYIAKEKAWQRWLTIILGAWMFVAGFIPGLVEGSGYLWNNLLAGILIAIGGFAAMSATAVVKHA
jgi:sulfite exporter TauE/SafE